MSKQPQVPAGGAEPSGRIRIKNICVATDFSEASKQALGYAALFAERFHASLHLLHVLHELGPSVPSVDYMACHELAHDYFEAEEQKGLPCDPTRQEAARNFLQCLETQTRRRMEEFIASSPVARMPTTIAIRYGHPVEEICRYAAKNAVDLLLLGAHGRTGLAFFTMGSVAERVVRVSPCAVLTVRLPRSTALKEEQEQPAAESMFRQTSATRS